MSSDGVLVYLRARDAEASIGGVLASILAQEDVTFELVVFDDASKDGTAATVRAIQDPRVRLVRNERPLGEAGCKTLALQMSKARFVAELPERGEALPGALRKLVDACAAEPRIGLSHGLSLVGGHEQISREEFRARRAFFLRMDPRRELLRRGDVLSPLRVYRREALESVLDARNGARAPELIALVRMAERFEISFVPELLFRAPEGKSSRGRALQEALACWQEHRRNGGLFAGRGYSVPSLLAGRAASALGLPELAASASSSKKRAKQAFARSLRRPLEALYYTLIRESGRLLPEAPSADPRRPRRIAYYLWHFPVLSQTFLNRELAALHRSGIPVDIVSDEPEDLEGIDHNAEAVLANATWLHPIDERRLQREARYFRARHPLRYARTLIFLMTSRYSREKRPRTDRKMLARAIYLAGVLREKGATHVHAPWADRCALVALVASRLLGIPFSLQARAHEIHRKSFQDQLRVLVGPAAFIITNTRYNESHLRALLPERERAKIHVVPNGIDLERFVPARRARTAQVRILSVARLIEQKGLVHLLEACRLLLDRGVDLMCEVVGGPEEPLYVKYHLELRKAHRRLGLVEHVRFTGALPFRKVLDSYREADVFALPCVIASDGARDIIPNSLLEAMAMELPAVTTSIGGIPEMVEHGVSGVIVPPGDAVALADAIEELMRDPERAARLGAAARRRIEEKFDIEKNVRRFVELFSAGARLETEKTTETERYRSRPSLGRADSLAEPATTYPPGDRTQT